MATLAKCRWAEVFFTCYRLSYLTRMRQHTHSWMAHLHWEPLNPSHLHNRDNYLASRVPGPGRCEGLLRVPGRSHLCTLNVRLTLLSHSV